MIEWPPRPVIFALLVECVLILFTLLMLIQPKFAFHRVPDRVTKMAMTSGLVLLCLTFCWSVICGMLFTLYQVSLPL